MHQTFSSNKPFEHNTVYVGVYITTMHSANLIGWEIVKKHSLSPPRPWHLIKVTKSHILYLHQSHKTLPTNIITMQSMKLIDVRHCYLEVRSRSLKLVYKCKVQWTWPRKLWEKVLLNYEHKVKREKEVSIKVFATRWMNGDRCKATHDFSCKSETDCLLMTLATQ